MSLSVDTRYGKVTVSKPYYSFILWGEVVSVTLFKPENCPNGYGVCKEFVASRKKKIHTRRFLEEFAKQAAAIF
ncbi:hypothetical protein ACGRH2_25865 [Vibrio barjaei]|uniref:Uncharacterized protein n=1 Tax=Vibrio barjaei TaxID=1676683 RepID=A0ABW7IQA9_9VIBR